MNKQRCKQRNKQRYMGKNKQGNKQKNKQQNVEHNRTAILTYEQLRSSFSSRMVCLGLVT